MRDSPGIWGVASKPLALLARGIGAVVRSVPLEKVGTRECFVAFWAEEAFSKRVRLDVPGEMFGARISPLAICTLVETRCAAMTSGRVVC